MAAGWNKGKKIKKLTEEQCRKISLGRLNSPKIQAQKEEIRRRRELQKQIKAQLREEEIARRGWIRNSPETRKKLSETNKGRTAWNKGVEAWNRGISWPNEVKENISRGMVVYWIQKKESKTQIV